MAHADNHDDSPVHVLRLLFPHLQAQNLLARKVSILGALLVRHDVALVTT